MTCVNWCAYSGTIPSKDDPDSELAKWEIDLSTFSNWFRNEILKILEGETPVVPTTLYVACHSTVCTAASPGTELSGDGYARTAITFERVTDVKRWNPTAVSSPTATANWSEIMSFSLWDAATGGNYYAFGNLVSALSVTSSKAVNWGQNKVIVGMGSPL